MTNELKLKDTIKTAFISYFAWCNTDPGKAAAGSDHADKMAEIIALSAISHFKDHVTIVDGDLSFPDVP